MQTITSTIAGNLDDADYSEYLNRIQTRLDFSLSIQESDNLFVTKLNDTNYLWDAFFNALPEEEKAFHDCHCCKNFIKRFGDLCYIDAEGYAISALWHVDDAPTVYKASVVAMLKLIHGSRVIAFYSSNIKCGYAQTGNWTHFNITLPREVIKAERMKAIKCENFKTVMRSLQEYDIDTIEDAVRLLNSGKLHRDENVRGAAKWFLSLKQMWLNTQNKTHVHNLVWKAVSTAPDGFCHVKSSMLGTLLASIENGADFDTIRAKFNDKMDPTKYQRPQTSPTINNIEWAEKIIKELGVEKSLKRRYARLDEIARSDMWLRPSSSAPVTTQSTSIFGHLKNKTTKRRNNESIEIPPIIISWVKFKREILPNLVKIEYLASSYLDDYCTITTAVHEEAPLILKWDRENARNPFSWYLYSLRSPISQYGLTPGYVNISHIIPTPSHFYPENITNFEEKVIFVIEGARDSKNAGIALFPEIMRSEFHSIRTTIEAYSNSEKLEDNGTPYTVSGVIFDHKERWDCTLRVTDCNSTIPQEYFIDRWE